MALQITVYNDKFVYINCKLTITIKLSKNGLFKGLFVREFLFIYLLICLFICLFAYFYIIKLHQDYSTVVTLLLNCIAEQLQQLHEIITLQYNFKAKRKFKINILAKLQKNLGLFRFPCHLPKVSPELKEYLYSPRIGC